jgi:hypothetical protein
MFSKLSISALNINGLKHYTLGDKLSNNDFIDNIKDHDLIFLTETCSNEINSIPGFKAIFSLTATPKSNSSCRLSGGILLPFKKEFENIISLEKRTTNFLTKDLFFCGVYITPQRSRYFDEEIFDDLENDVASVFLQKRKCYAAGGL